MQVITEIGDDMARLVARVRKSLVTIENGDQGVGAGFGWRNSSWILTNAHVLQSKSPSVKMPDGTRMKARVVVREPGFDLAVIQVSEGALNPLPVCPTSVRTGELVFAVGHPLGQENHLSLGIVSSLDEARFGQGQGKIPILRSDVVLLPGNSGGPLLNAAGEVIGINTLVVGGDQGYAVPISLAEELNLSGLMRIAPQKETKVM